MLHTRVCELLGIECPVIQAAMGSFAGPELIAAVSNAGGLGSIGAGMRSPEDLRQQLARTRELTQRPFVVNYGVPMLNEESFAFTLAAKPDLVSFSLSKTATTDSRRWQRTICWKAARRTSEDCWTWHVEERWQRFRDGF